MPRLSPLGIVLACAACTHIPATAEPAIWRCGNAYSDRPCEGGKPLEPADQPSEAQRRQADEATRRDQAAAQRMERERLRLDAQPRHGVVIGPAAPKAGSPRSKLTDKKKLERPKKPDAFVASYGDPAAGKKKKKKKSD